MNTLFEEYIGRTLRQVLRGTGLDIRLQGPMNHALIAEDFTRCFATRPDIVISRHGDPLLIVDTKWKRLTSLNVDATRGVGQADVYQMMAYAHVYRCARDDIGANEGLLSSHRINGTDDTRLNVASIMLSDPPSLGDRLRTLIWDNIMQGMLSETAA